MEARPAPDGPEGCCFHAQSDARETWADGDGTGALGAPGHQGCTLGWGRSRAPCLGVGGEDGVRRALRREDIPSAHRPRTAGTRVVRARDEGLARRREDGGPELEIWSPSRESGREGYGMIHKERLFAFAAGETAFWGRGGGDVGSGRVGGRKVWRGLCGRGPGAPCWSALSTAPLPIPAPAALLCRDAGAHRPGWGPCGDPTSKSGRESWGPAARPGKSAPPAPSRWRGVACRLVAIWVEGSCPRGGCG